MGRRLRAAALAACDRFVPPDVAARSDDARRRGRLVVGFSLALGLWGPFYTLVYVALGSIHGAIAVLAGTPFALATPLILRHTRSCTFSGAWLGLVLSAVLGTISLYNGGPTSPALVWFAAVPMLAMLMAGWRVGLGFVVGAVAVVVAALVATRAGHAFPLEIGSDNLPTLAATGVATLVVLVASLAFIYEGLKDLALEQVNDANRRLASEVETHKATNAALAHEMEMRLQVEVELRQAQKLESVGRLAAGVAHEINTPVQFVGDSVEFLRDAMQEILGVMEKLRAVQASVLAGSPSVEAAAEAAAAEAAAELPDLLESMPSAFGRSLEGLARVALIVRSMKEFADPDATELRSVDLNRAIESTLTVASHEYAQVAEVETDFGQLPNVMCHVSEVNQVVLNILVNAAHAIGDVVRGTGRKGRIEVRTRRDGDDVVISIADTGSGIPAEIRDRVFDPFFTTKEVGKGSGQGLAIARSVVERHKGKLSLESTLGKGTNFFIRLPITAGTVV